jgi:L-lactate dehydrogenase complex protein LldG
MEKGNREMTPTLHAIDDQSVPDTVRRALGRSVTVAPEPLAPFVEPNLKVDARELIDQFAMEAGSVGARIHRVTSKLKLIEQLAEVCALHADRAMAISGADLFREIELFAGLAARGLLTFDGGEIEHDKLTTRLAECGVGVTAADCAIAETGTIVLTSDEPNALLVSLLPPVHVAVLRSSQIVARLDEAITKLTETKETSRWRSATFVTGPSRTGDVELVLSIGVHGPKELHVIILEEMDQ